MHIANRLKSERERLGYSQGDFAAVVDATRKTVFNWENGSGSPSAEVLAAWADVGLDVLYVVTGNRSFAPPPKYSAKAQLLIEYFEQAPESTQKKLLRIVLDDDSVSSTPSSPKRSAVSQAAGPETVQVAGNKNLVAMGGDVVKVKGGFMNMAIGSIGRKK